MIGKRIASLREQLGIDQKTFAKSLDINPSVMNRIELGHRPLRHDEVKKIAEYFNVSTDYLLGYTQTEKAVPTTLSPIEVGTELQQILAERNLSSVDVDRDAKVKEGTTAKIIKGKYEPHLDVAAKIAKVLDIPASLLLGVREDKQSIQKQRFITRLYEEIPKFCPTDDEIQHIVGYIRFFMTQKQGG